MQKRAPTLGNILVIILFALSCFGLLMFLWGSFGGPLPLKPKGYRMQIAFPRVLALAEQSNVRISGVDVGHVISVKKGTEGKTIATVEINQKYAPIRQNVHAIIRQKTLLGETYVQLIPQAHVGPYVADDGELPPGNVEKSVTLDDILATFDPKTRAAFKIWQTVGRRRHQRARRTDQRLLRGARTVRRKRQQAAEDPRHPGGGAASAGEEHRRRLRRAREPRPPARRADRQRRTHLQSGRLRQRGVGGGVPGAAGLRAQLAQGAAGTRQVLRRREPVPRRIPPGRAQPLLAAVRRQAVRAAVRQVPDVARAR